MGTGSMEGEIKVNSRRGLSRYLRHVTRLESWRRLISHFSSWPRRMLLRRKLAAQKMRRAQMQYLREPRVGAIVQFFNKRGNIPMLWRGLQAAAFDEIIVLEDGSVDGSAGIWQKQLQHPNQVLIRTNDLYEIIGYDRAMRYCKAEIVVLLQDDDEPPPNDRWVRRALELFDAHPEMVYLGAHHSMDILPRDPAPEGGEADWTVDGDLQSIAGVFKQRMIMLDERHDAFQFVMATVRSPVFIRRKEFLEIGGFDLDFAPFIGDDVDNCIRIWQAGYKVGVFNVKFRRDIGLGGMRAFNKASFGPQTIRNWHRIYQKHVAAIADGSVRAKVEEANRGLRVDR